MPKAEADYSKTIIYKLCCNDPTISDIYIGHTTHFIQRKSSHKTSCCNENDKKYKQYVYEFIRNNGGWENWAMIQIEELNCKNKREAETVEHYWIEKLNATLNSNKPYAMCKENTQTYKNIWYEEKKDYILQKAKEHYQENKEHKLEYQKQYAEENKDKITEQQKEYREKNKEKLAEKKKIYREAHKEEARIAHKAWKEANKETLKAKKSVIIICECGTHHTFANKIRHLQTKVHKKFLDELCGIVEPVITEEEQIEIDKAKKIETKEKQKKYRDENAEKIHEYKKKNYEANKAKIVEQNKKYYEEHKEDIIEKNKQYAEQNKDKIKNNKNEWYQKNKENILQKHKEIIICECSAEIRKAGRSEHYKSKKHKDYLVSKNLQTEENIILQNDELYDTIYTPISNNL
jgi:hypothetical protein